jgi:hypothetical protein
MVTHHGRSIFLYVCVKGTAILMMIAPTASFVSTAKKTKKFHIAMEEFSMPQ